MAQISIQSEAFLKLYHNMQPELERRARDSELRRAMTYTMPAYSFSVILTSLYEIKELAERGIALAGAGASQVVLDGNEVRMLEWSREQLEASK